MAHVTQLYIPQGTHQQVSYFVTPQTPHKV